MTASAIISFSEKLEEQSSTFYKTLAQKFPEQEEILLLFAKQSQKNQTIIIRTYRETISDALEACFSFESFNLHDYEIAPNLNDGNLEKREAYKIAIAVEEKAFRFYTIIAEQSDALLATIPRIFRKVARERQKRKEKLESLLNNTK